MDKQYPKRMKCKYRRDQIVWVLNYTGPRRGIIVRIDCDTNQPHNKPLYDVMLLDGDNTEVNPDYGSITISGLEEYRVYEEPIGAARELYSFYADMHHELGHALAECLRHWSNPEFIVSRLNNYRERCETE